MKPTEMTQGKWFQLFLLLCLPIMLVVGCNPIIGSDWTLVSLNGHEVIPETTVTASFINSYIAGYTECNRYTLNIIGITRTTIAFEDAAAVTDALCSEEGFMEQEEEYLQTLPQAVSYTLFDGQLAFKNEAGEVILIFQEGMPEGLRY